jgi:hypothetical protein
MGAGPRLPAFALVVSDSGLFMLFSCVHTLGVDWQGQVCAAALHGEQGQCSLVVSVSLSGARWQ